MPFYIHHRFQQPLTVSSVKTSNNDIEISDELAQQFLTRNRMLSDFKIHNHEVVEVNAPAKKGDGALVTLTYTAKIPNTQLLVVSPNSSFTTIDFFTLNEIIDAVDQKEFEFIIDGKSYTLNLNDFVEGQYTLEAEFSNNSEFKISRVVDRIALYRNYGSYFYRHANNQSRVRRTIGGALQIDSTEERPVYICQEYNPNIVIRISPPKQPVRLNVDEAAFINGAKLEII